MFEVEYLWKGWAKKDGLNPNLELNMTALTSDPHIDFAFSPCLRLLKSLYT